MKNQREMIKALLDGEKLVMSKLSSSSIIEMDDQGITKYNHGGECDMNDICSPSKWQIYKEPKWYENIPSVGGVLCHVCEQADWDEFEDTPRIITEYKNNMFYDSDGLSWAYAKPIPKKMIQVLAYNAPEE